MTKKGRLILFAVSVVLLPSLLAYSVAASDDNVIGEWKILTKQNFSSQIRLHPHILLLVTLPWSGESRSLMKELAHLVTERREKYGSLKLMLMLRNKDKMLADAMDASNTKETSIVYYHHSVPYKYKGRLRAHNVLFSIYPYMSRLSEELSLERLNTPEELNAFLESTDKALLLLEFCGWTPKLLAKGMKNGTENGFGLPGDLVGPSVTGETERGPTSSGKNISQITDNEELKCGSENGHPGVPWLAQFSSENDTSYKGTENRKLGIPSPCSIAEYELFDSFFSIYMNVARGYFLPPEKHKFGLVSERLMLSSLGIGDSSSWLAVLYSAKCPSCTKIIREEEDLKNVFEVDNSVVSELEGDGNDLEPALPSNKPSVILFVDRSSDSSESRKRSNEALGTFRELALNYHISSLMGDQSGSALNKYSFQDLSNLRHPRLKLSPTARVIKLKEKMSTIMVVSEGKHITLDKIASDLQGNSLQGILSYLRQQQKETKLSSLAKDLGFQLLSDDVEIKLASSFPSQVAEDLSDQVSGQVSEEGTFTNLPDDNDHSDDGGSITFQVDMKYSESNVEPSSQHVEEKTSYSHRTEQLPPSIDSDQSSASPKLTLAEDMEFQQESPSLLEESQKKQPQFRGFKGSFFFCDGNYRLLRALTGKSEIPSMLIVDPIMQQHYVASDKTEFSYLSQADFLTSFLNESLLPYNKSESVPKIPRETVHPPFVNLDFREAESVPRVTAHTFNELVHGFDQTGIRRADHTWNKDVLVLFTNSWCGFCQRIELVVREVYRGIKGYTNMLKRGSRNEKTVLSDDGLNDEVSKLPVIYLMDCTLNDCSLIFKSIDQREVYPALILFPAGRKEVLRYEGDIAVTDVIKFLAEHGSNSQLFNDENGILRTSAGKETGNSNLSGNARPTSIHMKAENLREVLLKDRVQESTTTYNDIPTNVIEEMQEAVPNIKVGSVLIATEKLYGVQPFDQSHVLIVRASQDTGFQGLIINKHMKWDSLGELEKGLEMLTGMPLSLGGPLVTRGMSLLALAQNVGEHQYPEVLSGVYFLDQSATVHEIEKIKAGNQSSANYCFFLGYSSWGWDQLFSEISGGAWTLADDSMEYFHWRER